MLMALAGCTPSVETKSDDDISTGDQKVSDATEMQSNETADQNDDSKMTQVDPDLTDEVKGRESFSESSLLKNADVSVRKRLPTLSTRPISIVPESTNERDETSKGRLHGVTGGSA